MSERRLLAIILGFSVVRLAVAPWFDLFPQEAYYDLYGRHLALSYFDHPPLIGWSLWSFTTVFGDQVWVLRLCAFCLSAVTQVLLWRLVREAIAPERRVPALLLLVTPFMSVVSLISTPDVPLLLFSSAALLFLWRAFQGPERSRAASWLAAGVATGLAFDSKYTAVFLLAGAFLLLLDPLHRRQLRTPWPYLAAIVAAGVTAPVWIWNAEHQFASLRFQTVQRAEATHLQLRYFGGLLTTQTFLLGLLFLLLLWVGLRLPLQLRTVTPERRPSVIFFAVFSVPPALFFVALSFISQVKANWLEPFYLAGVPFLALLWPKPERLIKPTLGWSVIVQALAAIEILLAPFPIHSNDSSFGWRDLATTTASLRAPGDFVFSVGGIYKVAAELEFYSGQKVYAGNILGRQGLEYDYLGDDLTKLRGRDALFIDSDTELRDEAEQARPPIDLAGHFAAIYQLDPLVVRAHGHIVRKFWFWRCRDYLGP